MANQELLSLVRNLRNYDHCFLSREGALSFTQPFGFDARTRVHKAEPNEPKGLILDNGATEAEGIDAAELAMQICHHVGVQYTEMFGRGSQLRACCDALESHFQVQQ